MTEMRLPWSRAERTTPRAVPWPAVARAPVLQWVRTRAPSGTSAAPARPMARLASTSATKSARAASASFAAADFGSALFEANTARMRSSAQNRLTAVGRLSASVLNASSIASENCAGVPCFSRCASRATPNAAAQPMAGAPRTTIERIATATSAAAVQLTYSKREGRRRWSISSRRPSHQRSVWTADVSDDALIAAVDRHLGTGGLGEERAAHFRRELGDVAARDLGAQHVVGPVGLDRHAVLPGALRKNFVGPQAGVEYRVGMQRVDADAVRTPLERRDASELVQCRLRGRVGRSTRTRRRHVLRADHDHATAARRELEKGMAGAQEEHVRIEVDGHRFAPLGGRQLGDPAAGGKDARVQHQHVHPAEGDGSAGDREIDLLLIGHIAAQPEKIRASVE